MGSAEIKLSVYLLCSALYIKWCPYTLSDVKNLQRRTNTKLLESCRMTLKEMILGWQPVCGVAEYKPRFWDRHTMPAWILTCLLVEQEGRRDDEEYSGTNTHEWKQKPTDLPGERWTDSNKRLVCFTDSFSHSVEESSDGWTQGEPQSTSYLKHPLERLVRYIADCYNNIGEFLGNQECSSIKHIPAGVANNMVWASTVHGNLQSVYKNIVENMQPVYKV